MTYISRWISTSLFLAMTSGCGVTWHSRSHEGDARAIRLLRDLNLAEAEYFGRFGKYGTLRDLGPSGAALVSAEHAGSQQGGLNVSITQSGEGYSILVVPDVRGATGNRSFYTDHTRVIRQSWTNEAANSKSEPIE